MNKKEICFVLFLMCLFNLKISGQELLELDLEQARKMALNNNRLLKIQDSKISEATNEVTKMTAKGKPRIYATANYAYTFNANNFVIPQGGIGDILSVPIPFNDFTIYEAEQNMFVAGLFAYQPLTQLLRVSDGVSASRQAAELEKNSLRIYKLELSLGVEKLYYAVKIEQARMDKINSQIRLEKAKIYDLESATMAGKTLDVELLGARASLAQKEHELLQAQIETENYKSDLKVLLDIPGNTEILLDSIAQKTYLLRPLEYYLSEMNESVPEINKARIQLERAKYGLDANKNAYLPDLGIIGGATYQGVIPELPATNYFIGANLIWNVFGFGSRKADVLISESQIDQAALYLNYQEYDSKRKINKAYRLARQAESLIDIAAKGLEFRQQLYRVKQDQLEAGLSNERDFLEHKIALDAAVLDLYSARLNYNLKVLELQITSGKQ